MVQGSLKSGSDTQIISNAKLRADQLSFNAGGATLYRPRQWQHDRRHGHQRRQLVPMDGDAPVIQVFTTDS